MGRCFHSPCLYWLRGCARESLRLVLAMPCGVLLGFGTAPLLHVAMFAERLLGRRLRSLDAWWPAFRKLARTANPGSHTSTLVITLTLLQPKTGYGYL